MSFFPIPERFLVKLICLWMHLLNCIIVWMRAGSLCSLWGAVYHQPSLGMGICAWVCVCARLCVIVWLHRLYILYTSLPSLCLACCFPLSIKCSFFYFHSGFCTSWLLPPPSLFSPYLPFSPLLAAASNPSSPPPPNLSQPHHPNGPPVRTQDGHSWVCFMVQPCSLLFCFCNDQLFSQDAESWPKFIGTKKGPFCIDTCAPECLCLCKSLVDYLL